MSETATPAEQPIYWRHRYGIISTTKMPEWEVEAHAFRVGREVSKGGLGKYGHARKFAEMLWPDMEWNPWLERQWRGFTNEKYARRMGETIIRVVSMVGVAAAGKTFSATRFAFMYWLADPANTIGILTSTSKIAVGQKIWPVIQSSYHEARIALAKRSGAALENVNLGNLVDSRKILQSRKGDDARAIFAQAVADGETSKAEVRIRGQHAPRIVVLVDEANEVPEAIFTAVANLRKTCQDLLIMIIGNPDMRVDAHGRCCQPKGGWNQRITGQVEWPTEGVPEWQIDSGLCMQFRGQDSPNVKAGRTLHKHIYTWEDYQDSQREGVRNTLNYWKYDAGEWPPDGVCNTIFNETMVLACGLQDPVTWMSTPIPVSFMDPGFGGDACVQVIGLLGMVEDQTNGPDLGAFPTLSRPTKPCLLITNTVELEVRDDYRDESGKMLDQEHQIARQFIANCDQHRVEPRNAGLWATGTGRGIASVLFSDWSDEILKLEEGGSASDYPFSASDPRPGHEVCDRRVTEIWFSGANMAVAGQLKGLPFATIKELCAREYKSKGKPSRYIIETKDEFKPKLGHSPDKADATLGLCWLVRERHGVTGGGKVAARSEKRWELESAKVEDAWEAEYSEQNDQEYLLDVEYAGDFE